MTTKPWQIVALATLCFMQAVLLLTVVLQDLLVRANPLSAEAWADYGVRASGAGPDIEAVYLYLANSIFIFTIMMVVVFMFGFLLYRGEYLPAVRITGTVFFIVGLIGQVVAAGRGDDGTILDKPLVSLLSMGFDALVLVGFVSLFFGKPAQWVKSHPDS